MLLVCELGRDTVSACLRPGAVRRKVAREESLSIRPRERPGAGTASGRFVPTASWRQAPSRLAPPAGDQLRQDCPGGTVRGTPHMLRSHHLTCPTIGHRSLVQKGTTKAHSDPREPSEPTSSFPLSASIFQLKL